MINLVPETTTRQLVTATSTEGSAMLSVIGFIIIGLFQIALYLTVLGVFVMVCGVMLMFGWSIIRSILRF